MYAWGNVLSITQLLRSTKLIMRNFTIILKTSGFYLLTIVGEITEKYTFTRVRNVKTEFLYYNSCRHFACISITMKDSMMGFQCSTDQIRLELILCWGFRQPKIGIIIMPRNIYRSKSSLWVRFKSPKRSNKRIAEVKTMTEAQQQTSWRCISEMSLTVNRLLLMCGLWVCNFELSEGCLCSAI